MIQRYSKMIGDFGLDFFRQDGHPIVPADSGPDRKGMRQIRYIEGFYAFWDALLKDHPHLVIDNCAAGGRKIDIETIQRSIPLWRSDIQVNVNFDPILMQCQTYGISFWVPLSGGASSFPTSYSVRSGFSPALVTQWHIFDDVVDSAGFDFEAARRLLREYLAVRSYFYGDYYPLTSYSLKHDVWMAWQFHRPDLGEGMVQAFRRKESPYEASRFPLHGLEHDAQYMLTDRDRDETRRASGQELMDQGLAINIPDRPCAVTITYKLVKEP
jgi:alpha-galactosidase